MKINLRNVSIRSWSKGDAKSIAKYANNKNIWLNLRDGFPHPYSLGDAEKFIGNVLAKKIESFFAISTKEEAIGSIGLSLGQDVHRYTAELGYWLAEPFWNKGITTDSIRFISEFGFEHLKLVRIFAEPYASNIASSRVLEKAGFQKEGILKANVYKNRQILDQAMYAKIKIT
jgi:[ribosomal protein S5]-alanine N-acetyltransferase